MTITLGLTQIIYAVALLGYVVIFFVGAAYGKRVGMHGGTIKDSVSAQIAEARKQANAKLKEEIKRIKEQAKEQV